MLQMLPMMMMDAMPPTVAMALFAVGALLTSRLNMDF